jgi:thioredoxin-dependent peroxiredoxin
MRNAVSASMLFLCLAANLAVADEPSKADKPVDLNIGDTAPVFERRNDQDKTWTSTDHVGKKIVVLYFYPADFTTGCTAQAQKFRDGMNQLADKGVLVVGVSGDSVSTHELFKKMQMLNFTLLADEDGSLAKKFGVPVSKGGEVRPRDAMNKPILDADGNQIVLKREVTAARWTFIIGKDGKILYKNTKVNPAVDTKQVTEFIDGLEKK